MKWYPVNTVSWRLPKSKAKRVRLAVEYGTAGYALLTTVFAHDSPPWLADLPAVQVLRTVLLQNYIRDLGSDGCLDVRHRVADSTPSAKTQTRIGRNYPATVSC